MHRGSLEAEVASLNSSVDRVALQPLQHLLYLLLQLLLLLRLLQVAAAAAAEVGGPGLRQQQTV